MIGWMRFGRRRERGIALVIVLWAMTLLAIVAGSFAATSRTEIVLSRNLMENAKARTLAEAGIHRAVLGMMDIPGAVRWRADGTPYLFELGEGVVSISIRDERGKVDLNRATDALLRMVFVIAGAEEEEAEALVDAIKDYRDRDGDRRLNGAEDPEYRAAGLTHGAKDAPFEAVEELQQVLGVTPDLYRRAAPLLTVHSRQRGINPLTAPRQLLIAIPGADEAVIDEFLDRSGDDPETPATPRDVGSLPRSADVPFTSARINAVVATVRAEARTAGGATFVREAVVRLTKNLDRPFNILSWKQGRRGVAAAR